MIGNRVIRAKWDGPLGRGRPPNFEQTAPWQHYLPSQPTRRFSVQIPTQGNATWIPLEINAPSVLRLRSLPNGVLSPGVGIEQIEMFVAQEGQVPVAVNQGTPAYGNLAVLGNPGLWYYAIFANIACMLDAELIDITDQSIADALLNCPRSHLASVRADVATGAATDITLLRANDTIERRRLKIVNTMNVPARIAFGAAATATFGILLNSGVAGVPSALDLDAGQVAMQSVHCFGTGAGTTVNITVWT